MKKLREKINRYALMIESRQFANARRIYEDLKNEMDNNDWNLGYLTALKGIFLVKEREDSYSLFARKDLDNDKLNRIRRQFLKDSKNKIFTDFDRGYFASVADYAQALIRVRKKRKKS